MFSSPSLRTRLFLAVFLAVIVPSGLLLLTGLFAFREALMATGSAGPWTEVAATGRTLLQALQGAGELPPGVAAAAEAHGAQLSESVRFSRMYAFLGDRFLLLLPALAGLLLLLAVGLGSWAAGAFSRRLSAPVEELVTWTERIGAGGPLPREDSGEGARIPEFQELRAALRRMSGELDRARAEELERERMRSWTEMARRVAHDLKNPLTPMRIAARRVATSDDEGLQEAGQVLLEEISRLDEMARSFSDFARPLDSPPSPVDLGELLISLQRRMGAEPVPIRTHLPDSAVMVEGHPMALERAVRNLLVNAQEATMEREGEELPEEVELHLSTSGDHACIRVLDRGPGLPPGMEKRIWQPDYTTRRKGTGLGLALVQQVIRSHGGEVEGSSRAGGGAEFRVLLPLQGADEGEVHDGREEE